MKKIYKFLILTCFTLLSAWSNYAWGKSSLTVNIAGNGQIKVNTSSSQPSSWSSSSVTKNQNGGAGNQKYYIWAQATANSGYRLSGVTTDDSQIDMSIAYNNAGYYVVTIYSYGLITTNSKTVTVNFVADFYGYAESYADPSVGGKTYVSINGNWPNPSTDASQYKAHDESTRTTTAVTSAPKYTANFAAYLYDGYKFDGWYTEENKGGTKISGNTTYSEDFTANSTTSGSPTTITRYAHFTPVTVNSVASYTSTLNFTQPGNASTTVKFNVSNADATDDFTYTLTGELRDNTNGGWIVDSWSYANNQISIKLKYYCTKYTAQSSELVNHKATITLTSQAANGTSQSADVFANVNLTPTLSVSPTSKDFGEFTLAKDPVQTQTFTFTFNNLNSPADNIVLVTAPTAPFSASWTASSTNTKTLTVSFNPTAVDNWSQQIVVEARNSQTPYIAVPCTLTVSGSAKRNNVTYTCNIADNYMVDATAINLASLWTSNNNEQAPAYDIVSFTPSGSNNEGATAPAIDENNILSLGKAGTLVLSISQPQTTSFNKKDDTKTITIHKYTSTFANASNLTGKVGATNIQSNYTLTYVKPSGYVDNTTPTAGTPGLGSTSGNYYYTISQEVNRDNQVGCPAAHKDEVVVYNAGSKTATAWNKGVATISLKQKETYKFTEANTSFTITVDKNSNEIKTSYKWKDNNSATLWTRSLGFEDGAYVQFRSNNMETGAPSIIVRQIEGEDVATFFPDSVTNDVNGDAFYTSFTVGTARWKVSQPENYKYYAASETQFNLNVGESDCNCILDEWSWTDDLLHNPPTASEHNIVTFSGIGETLSFDARKKLAAGNQMKYQFYTNGEWSDATQITTHTDYETFGPYQLGEEDNNTTAVKFMKGSTLGGDTDDPFIKHIIVTRKRWMKLKATSAATATISSLAKLQRKVGTAEKTATFYVDFSTCSDKVKVASNHGNVTFANGLTKDTISTNTTGKTGYNAVVPVTIHYSSDTIESKTVTITVYTEDKNVTLTVPVQTTGIETELVYIGEVSYPVNSDNIAATSLFEVREKGTTTVVTGAAITIAKSGVSDAANVVENALEPLCGNKTINLTASFAGDNRHEPSSLATPQAITIDKIADAVSFNSHPVVVIGKSYDISAWASAHTALTFESGDDDIFSIDGTTLRAHKVGTTTLKATAAGNECTYLSGAFNTESITVQPGYIFNGNNDNQWEDESNWENGEKPTIDDDVIIRGNLVIDEEVEVKSLTIENTGNVTLTVNGSLTVGSGNSIEDLPGGYGNLHVENGGEVNLTTGQLNVNNFTLDANLGVTNENVTTPSTSGQVKNENMLNVSGDAYFRLALDPSGRASFGWYDFVVPFPVDVIGGISIAEDPTAVMKFNVNYAVMAYDEAKNAQRGKHWNKFSGTLQPGRAYTITLDDDYPWNTVVFKKKAGADVTGNRTFTTEYSGLGAETQYNGWNGLGNGTLHHAELDVPANAVIQLYDHTHKCYQPRAAKDYSLAVGLAFFMQFNGVQMVTLQNADGNAEFRAPRRAMNDVENFRLALTAEDAVNPADYIWVSASEDATGEYVIGRDVTKMGTISESTVARMWTQRSGMTLCSNEMPLVDDIAQCELGLYAPQARTYTIAIEEAPEDADLYLTYNGQIIWNLTAGAYTIDLAKGTTSGYGLRVEARAPQITTGVENTTIDGKSARKVLINNIIYIVTPEGEMYDLMGKSVK